MAFDVTDETFDPANNEIPAPAVPRQPGDEPAAEPVGEDAAVRGGAQATACGRSTATSGTTSSPAASRCSRRTRRADAVEIWELVNKSGGWQHPFHIHLIDFKILDRNGRPPFAFERGPKDVAYLGEDETVRVLIRFEGTGKYLMHCHNLVHEDHDMMVQFKVTDPNNPGIDPLSFPPKSTAQEAGDPL